MILIIISLENGESITDAARTLKLPRMAINNACKNLNSYNNYYWVYDVEILPGEIWKNISIEYGNTCISSHGRIMKENGHITIGSLHCGYMRISLYNIFTQKYDMIKVHRIVAKCFLENIPDNIDELMVNHKDGNKSNNHKDNLEYVTNQQNVQHAYNTGLNKNVCKIAIYDSQGNFIKIYPTIAEAARENKCPPTSIHSALNRDNNIYLNFYWLYVNS
jgi:hypothetical protein